MKSLKNNILSLKSKFNDSISGVETLKELEDLRVKFLGKNGEITILFKKLREISGNEKKEVASILNDFKKFVDEEIKILKLNLKSKIGELIKLKQKNFDVTAYKTGLLKGHLHPYSQFTEEIENIFISMGYDILDGPFVETDYYNFTSLNIPEDHPARDMHDTFWLNKKNYLLRTHTSTLQVKAMETIELPIAAFVPGYAFRHEAVDASHDFMFMQCEGFLIDKNITLSHLFATVKFFLGCLFKNKKLDMRIRPGFFPFVEPGVEIDIRCPFCKSGCSVCKKTTWIEVFPAGLIHPNVLKAGGIDPEKYSGFAFGFGLTLNDA